MCLPLVELVSADDGGTYCYSWREDQGRLQREREREREGGGCMRERGGRSRGESNTDTYGEIE